MKIKTAMSRLIAGLLVSGVAQASLITVEFDVNITSKQEYANYFIPIETVSLLHQYASVTFDNTLTSTDRYTSTQNIIMQHVRNDFGGANQTLIVSPLEYLANTNPLIGAPVNVSSITSSNLWYSHAPPDYSQVSFGHQVYFNQSSTSQVITPGPFVDSPEVERWSTGVMISSLEYLGSFDQAALENYNFTSDMLMAHLLRMRDTGGTFSFSEGYHYSSNPGRLFASGYGWTGTATITNIIGLTAAPVPEPNILALLFPGLVVVALTSRRKRAKAT